MFDIFNIIGANVVMAGIPNTPPMYKKALSKGTPFNITLQSKLQMSAY